MSKHTPGPWAMPDSGKGRISKVGANGGWDGLIATADCGDYARSKSEGLANARLIAAAPDLLEALQNLSIVMQELHDHWDNDRDAKVGKILIALSGHLPRYDKRIDELHAAIAKAIGGKA